MSIITADAISEAIATAPAWARVALTTPKEGLRTDALRQLGEHVYSTLYRAADTDRDQLALPL